MEKKLSSTHAVSFADDTPAAGESRRPEKLATSSSSGQRRVLSFSLDQGGDGEGYSTQSPSSVTGHGARLAARAGSMCESGEYPVRDSPGAQDSSIVTGEILETNGEGHREGDSGLSTAVVTTPKRGRVGRGAALSGSMRGSPSRRAMMVESIRRFSVNPASFIAERRKSRSHSLASFKLSYYPQNDRKLVFEVLSNFSIF